MCVDWWALKIVVSQDTIFLYIRILCLRVKQLFAQLQKTLRCYILNRVIEGKGTIKNIKNTFVLYMPSNQKGLKGLEYFKDEE